MRQRVAQHEALERVLGDRYLLRREQQLALAVCKLGRDLGTFKRCRGAGLDPDLDLPKILLGKVYVCHLVLLVAKREDKIPIRSLHVGNRLGNKRSKICVGLLEPLLRDSDLMALAVDMKIARERLRVVDAEARRK